MKAISPDITPCCHPHMLNCGMAFYLKAHPSHGWAPRVGIFLADQYLWTLAPFVRICSTLRLCSTMTEWSAHRPSCSTCDVLWSATWERTSFLLTLCTTTEFTGKGGVQNRGACLVASTATYPTKPRAQGIPRRTQKPQITPPGYPQGLLHHTCTHSHARRQARRCQIPRQQPTHRLQQARQDACAPPGTRRPVPRSGQAPPRQRLPHATCSTSSRNLQPQQLIATIQFIARPWRAARPLRAHTCTPTHPPQNPGKRTPPGAPVQKMMRPCHFVGHFVFRPVDHCTSGTHRKLSFHCLIGQC